VYDLENGEQVVRVSLREGQARRLRVNDLPRLDRPLWFTVTRGKREVLRARSVAELEEGLLRLPREGREKRRRR
jgi:hypothetical protein